MNHEWRAKHKRWAVDMAERRDARIVNVVPSEALSMTQLLVWAQQRFREVAKQGIDVEKLVQMTGANQQERALVCGERKGACFVRRDGVGCNFRIVVREVGDTLQLVSYVLHLDAPKDHSAGPQFLRWEYSATRKANVDAMTEPLAHIHPGHDDVRLPSAVLSPKELIAVFLSLEIWT